MRAVWHEVVTEAAVNRYEARPSPHVELNSRNVKASVGFPAGGVVAAFKDEVGGEDFLTRMGRGDSLPLREATCVHRVGICEHRLKQSRGAGLHEVSLEVHGVCT